MSRELSGQELIRHMRQAVLVTDPHGLIEAVNPAFTEVTGYGAEEVIGQNPKILKSGRQGPDFYAQLWASLAKFGTWQGEIWNRRKNGEIYPEWLTITAIQDKRGQVARYLGVFTDISSRKLTEECLTHLALYDSVTRLPNRVLLQDRLIQALATAHRDGHTVAVLFFDIDYFKQVNDSWGHAVGDELLIGAGERLKACMREGDTVARYAGDEFVAVLPEVVHLDDALKVAHKILTEMARPFPVTGRDISTTVSLGIAFYPQDGRDAATLLQKADEAMYKAKQRGRNNFQFFGREVSG